MTGSGMAGASGGPSDDVPFVASLRSQPNTVRLATAGQAHITIRVEVPEVWDVVRVEAAPSTTVRAVKTRALAALYPDKADVDAFVMKLNGAEIHDEDAALADAGVKDGSTFLLTFRRRRPVKS